MTATRVFQTRLGVEDERALGAKLLLQKLTQRRHQLGILAARIPALALGLVVEVPGGALGGEPDLLRGTVAVDDVPVAVFEGDRQHAAREISVELVSCDISRAPHPE